MLECGQPQTHKFNCEAQQNEGLCIKKIEQRFGIDHTISSAC